MKFTDIRRPDGQQVRHEDYVFALIEFEIPTNFGNLHDFIGLRPIGQSGLSYEFEHLGIIRDTDIASQNPQPIDDDTYRELSEMKVIKYCPRPSIMMLEDGTLAAPSDVLYPDWMSFGRLRFVSDRLLM